MTASGRPGMGSVPYADGTTFRVWAPNAQSVAVAGTFNAWSQSADPLGPEGNGYWSRDVRGAGPGDEYRYVIVHAGAVLQPWRADPYAREMTTSAGNSVVHDPGFDWGSTPFRMPGWDELVIYELHVGSFNDAPGGPPAALASVVDRLPYLVELGVTAIQLLPPAEFPGGFSWGYNPSSIFAVESDYGGPDALKLLIRTAHEHGLAVLCDVVYNHFGTGDSAVWRFDGWHRDSNPGGIYCYDAARIDTPWGPRPDYGRGEVRQYVRDNALAWLEDFRFDGLRWDATNYIRNLGGDGDPGLDVPDGWGLLRWINDEIDGRQPWKISIAEDLQGNDWLTRDVGAGGAGFDSQWDGDFLHPVRAALTRIDDGDRDMGAVRGAIEHRFGTDALQRVVYTESHDEVARDNGKVRLPRAITPDDPGSWFARKRSVLGAVLVFTVPGIPMIFQGQEFLEDVSWHDDIPLDWTKRDRHRGIVQLYRDLVALRRDTRGTTRGLRGQHVDVHHVNHADKVVAFHRYAAGGPRDSVLVVLNMANRSYQRYRVGVPREGLWRVRLNSDWAGYDAGFGQQPTFDTSAGPGGTDGMPYAVDLGLGPYTAVVLSQDE